MDPDKDPVPDPDFFVSDLQDVNKRYFFLGVFAYYFVKVRLHNLGHKERVKQ